MSDNKKYYYLKLKEGFFNDDEILVLESLPNGIYYSNLLIKLYLKSIKFNGALRFNEYIPYDENMIATITKLNVDIVRNGLNALASMKLIERLDDGTIYMMNIQSFIGKSSSEADRKRLYRERIEEEKVLIGQMSGNCPIDNGTLLDKHPPEIEKEIDNRDKERYKDREYSMNNRDKYKDLSDLEKFLDYFARSTFLKENFKMEDIKTIIIKHGINNVKKAIVIALEKGIPTITYINGILNNWAKEGYPKEGKGDESGGKCKVDGAVTDEFTELKQYDSGILSDEKRKFLENELI